jgi:predicted ester cyclase
LHYAIAAEVAQGDEVVLRLLGTGTHVGELFGTAGSGRAIKWEEMHVFRFDVGARIVEHWGLQDVAAMMMQVGLMPPVERW